MCSKQVPVLGSSLATNRYTHKYMKIFISHINEDEKLALSLKGWIEKSFLGQIQIFVSSNPNDIIVGEQWFKGIENFLIDSDIILILASKLSLNRRWINFEAGAGWIKNIPVIPICYSGIEKSSLPSPLSFFQSINLKGDKFSTLLFDAISKHLKFPKAPNIDYDLMNKEVLQAIGEYFEEEDLGYLDHIESMENGFKTIGEIFNSFTSNMVSIQIETSKLSTQINTENAHPSQGTARFLQRQSKKYSRKIDTFTQMILTSNDSYKETVTKIEKNIHFVFHYATLQSEEDITEIKKAVAIIGFAITEGVQAEQAFLDLNKIIASLPKYEKHLNRSLQSYSKQLDTFTENLDNFLDVLRKAEIDGNNIIQSFNS